MAQEYSVHFLYVDRGSVILYSVQIVPTTFIVFGNFFILLILFSSSEYKYTISEFFGDFWGFSLMRVVDRYNFDFLDENSNILVSKLCPCLVQFIIVLVAYVAQKTPSRKYEKRAISRLRNGSFKDLRPTGIELSTERCPKLCPLFLYKKY